MSDNRIIAVSTSCRREPYMCMVAVTGSAVHVASVEALPANTKKLDEKLKALVAQAKKVNAQLVVEDSTGLFGHFGRSLRLADKDATNRPVLVSAFEKYQALTALSGLTFPNAIAAQLQITQSMYNTKHSDTGGVTYEIDWERLKDPVRVLLLAIHAGLCQTPYQSTFLSALMSSLAGHTPERELPTTYNGTYRTTQL